jgi:hypothetical protein
MLASFACRYEPSYRQYAAVSHNSENPAYTDPMFTGEWMYWLGWAGAIIVTLSMIIMAWWALFSDRPRGRRRCPQCWYDMSYSPGMSCSECGFTATSERQLQRTRRRWGYAVLALLTTFVVTFNIRHMAVEHGMVSLMPTRVLTIGMALTDDPTGAIFGEVRRRFSNGLFSESELSVVIDRCIKGDWRARPPDDAWIDKYGNLLRFWRFELAMMHRRADTPEQAMTLRAIEERLTEIPVRTVLTTRHTWPREVPAVALLRVDEWWPIGSMMRVQATPISPDAPQRVLYQSNRSFTRSAFGIPLGILSEEASEVELDVRVEWRREDEFQWQEVWKGRLTSPVRVEGDIADAIAPVDNAELSEGMRQTFRGELRRWSSGRSPLRFYYRPDFTRGPAFEDVAIGVALKLSHDDRLVRELHMWWLGGAGSGERALQNFGWEIVYEDLEAIAAADPDVPGWVFTVEGRPELALRAGEAKHYWLGSFSVPAVFRFRGSEGEAPPPDWWTDDQETIDSP